jgi:hypothetical protein
MSGLGLQFAPALPDDEAAYFALYLGLATFQQALQAPVAR